MSVNRWFLLIMLLLTLGIVEATANAQGIRVERSETDANGRPLSGLTALVCSEPATGNPCNTPVNVYSNKDLATIHQLTQPFPNTSLGDISFYVSSPGKYHLQVLHNGTLVDEVPDLEVVAAATQVPLSTPASSTATCTAGTIWADTNYVYVCVATNTIKRSALSAF